MSASVVPFPKANPQADGDREMAQTRKKLLGAIPKHQQRDVESALARLKSLQKEEPVLQEWEAGLELFESGELQRFSHTATFFFLFGKACRGQLSPIWGRTLARLHENEIDSEKIDAIILFRAKALREASLAGKKLLCGDRELTLFEGGSVSWGGTMRSLEDFLREGRRIEIRDS